MLSWECDFTTYENIQLINISDVCKCCNALNHLKYYFKLDSFASSNVNFTIIGRSFIVTSLGQLHTLRKVGYLIEVKLMEN